MPACSPNLADIAVMNISIINDEAFDSRISEKSVVSNWLRERLEDAVTEDKLNGAYELERCRGYPVEFGVH